jgi:glutamyl-tRNA synthetase
VDDADLRISHIVRGQDHLTNTFKHMLIFEGLGSAVPLFAHLPLLIAPDGSKLSKRKHGPVVSVMTYRDAGFLPQGYVNFLCLLGWNPKDNREVMSRAELVEAFSWEGVNRSNATVNFSEADPIDPKAMHINAQHIYALSVEDLTDQLLPVVEAAGIEITREQLLRITPLIQKRIKTLKDVLTVADFFFNEDLKPYDAAELIPQKGYAAMAQRALERARTTLATDIPITHDALDPVLRANATELGVKAGQMFQPIRVAVCGRKEAPPLFETLEVLGRDKILKRIDAAIALLRAAN